MTNTQNGSFPVMKKKPLSFQERLKSQEETISSIKERLAELEARDRKRELALEAANFLLDKELARVSTFVEDKVNFY